MYMYVHVHVCNTVLTLLNLQLNTPLHEASAAGQTAVVTLLLYHGADSNASDNVGCKYVQVIDTVYM